MGLTVQSKTSMAWLKRSMPVVMSALNSFYFRVFLQNTQWRASYRCLNTQSSAVGNKSEMKIVGNENNNQLNWNFSHALLLSSEEDEFRVLDLKKNPVKNFMANRRRNYVKRQVELTPRAEKMPVDQDWPSVWPTARVFHPATGPLPLHQGFVDKAKRSSPNKFGNAELMKIPNFLHLTPPAIERHCEALKSIITIIYFINLFHT